MTPRRIGRYDAELTTVELGGDAVRLWRVADLERHVDRTALLSAVDPPEPPYWAHLWSGAVVLARVVPPHAGRVLDLGCGLGLPGIVAACRGARVTFVDRVPEALAFVRASAEANACPDVRLLVADATSGALRGRFDLVLAAELLYEREAFPTLARTVRELLAPGGRLLLSDAGRTDTRAFYSALAAVGFAWQEREESVREEGLPVRIRVVEAVLAGRPA